MELHELIVICKANGLFSPTEGAEKLAFYAKLLRGWNAKINLISRKDEEHVLDRHILHSLTLRVPSVCDFDFTNKRVADLGTGGGLPGIPLKIVTPSIDMTLIDSIQKKITACGEMITELDLIGIHAARGRAEELASEREFAHTYDAVVSRAVAPLDELAKWSRGLLKPGGILLALKGGEVREEILQTWRLSFVQKIKEQPLRLFEYDEFEREGKKLITVTFV